MPSATPVFKTKKAVSLVLNAAIVIMELVSLTSGILSQGASFFRYYTQDSNLFALVACALLTVYTVLELERGKPVPQWVKSLKYMSVCCLALTFVVVVAILAPSGGLEGYRLMLFSGDMLYTHFLCPVLAMLSFVFFESGTELYSVHTFYALVPTVIYAAVSITLNIAGVMSGPYFFLHVYEQPIYMSALWCVLILALAYLLAWLLRRLNRRFSKRVHKK